MGRVKDFDDLKQLKLTMVREKSRLDTLQEAMFTLGGNGNGDGKVDGGGINRMEDNYINMIDLVHNQEVAYNLITIKYYTLENKIYSNINKVGKINELYAIILYERFVKGRQIDAIADQIGYSDKRYFQLQKEALKCYETLTEDIKEIEI